MQFGQRVSPPTYEHARRPHRRFSVLACLVATVAYGASYVLLSPLVLALEAVTSQKLAEYDAVELMVSMSGSLPSALFIFAACVVVSQSAIINIKSESLWIFILFPAALDVIAIAIALTLLGSPPDDPWLPLLAGLASGVGGVAMRVVMISRTRQPANTGAPSAETWR